MVTYNIEWNARVCVCKKVVLKREKGKKIKQEIDLVCLNTIDKIVCNNKINSTYVNVKFFSEIKKKEMIDLRDKFYSNDLFIDSFEEFLSD